MVTKRDEANGRHVVTAAGFGDRRIEGEEQGKAVVSRLKDATEKRVCPERRTSRRAARRYYLTRRTFRRLVKRYNANHRVRSFTCRKQFLAMTFGQLTYW